MKRRLLFFAHYASAPFWDLETGGMVSMDWLPLSEGVRDRTWTWTRRWDELHANPEEPPSGEAAEQLERDGYALWLDLRRELAGEWPLGYVTWPAAGRSVQWEPDGPVELCPP